MSFDISIAARKPLDKAHAEKYAASWDNSGVGPAGYAATKKAPVSLTDKQCRILGQFSSLVPKARRAAYNSAVMARLSGSPGDAACMTACINAAADGYIGDDALAAHGIVQHKDYEKKWRSKAVMGTGR
jgi:hypothetical protein